MGFAQLIIDAHQHFWRIDRGVNGWIDDSLWELRRDYLPEHLAPYLRHLAIDKTILVQAAETLAENPFMLELATATDFVGGVVAWVDLMAADCPAQLEALAQHSIVKGIRPVLQGIADSDWVLQSTVLNHLRLLPGFGLRFDALVQPHHLGAIQRLHDTVPDLAIVIDHAAKPVIGDGTAPAQDWQDGMAALSQRPGIFCKLSGLATEYGHGWSATALRPVSDYLLAHFGAERMMWGSDWPVLERHGSYSQWFSAACDLIGPQDQPAVFGQSAARFYGIT